MVLAVLIFSERFGHTNAAIQSAQKQKQEQCFLYTTKTKHPRTSSNSEVPMKVLILADYGFRSMRCGQQMHLHGRISLQYMYVIKEETSWDEMLYCRGFFF